MNITVDWVFINDNLALQQMSLSKCLHFILKALYNAILYTLGACYIP